MSSPAPPVGDVQGLHAVTLYSRFRERMKLGERVKGRAGQQAALGIVDTEVHRVRAVDNKLVAGWTTTIGTDRKQGFEVSGSHTFTFEDGKIRSLKVVVSPKASMAAGLSLDELTVDDIGQLSLAAWAVV
jgi:hypothetical protein